MGTVMVCHSMEAGVGRRFPSSRRVLVLPSVLEAGSTSLCSFWFLVLFLLWWGDSRDLGMMKMITSYSENFVVATRTCMVGLIVYSKTSHKKRTRQWFWESFGAKRSYDVNWYIEEVTRIVLSLLWKTNFCCLIHTWFEVRINNVPPHILSELVFNLVEFGEHVLS